MIKSERKILAIEILLSIFLFVSIFLKNIVNDYFVIVLLLITIALIYLFTGYEKDSNVNGEERRKLLQYISFYGIGFIIFEYGIGFLTGYIESPYKRDILNILKNTFLVILIILLSELLRYMIVKKGEKNKLILINTIILFVLVDSALNARLWDLNVNSQLLQFITIIILPSIFKNIMLTTFTNKFGMKPSIVYRLITELYIFIVPFSPDLGLYLESVFLMVFPILLSRIISFGFDKSKREKFKFSKKKRISIAVIMFLTFTAIIVALNSNLFRFWMVAVGSGSMEPTINVGDVIIVDKQYQENLDDLVVGDVLLFKIGNKLYTHRITKITKSNGLYSINTKGDREGQMEDSWVVTNQNVIGVVKYKIKYIGYPTVWLSRILEGNNG